MGCANSTQHPLSVEKVNKQALRAWLNNQIMWLLKFQKLSPLLSHSWGLRGQLKSSKYKLIDPYLISKELIREWDYLTLEAFYLSLSKIVDS